MASAAVLPSRSEAGGLLNGPLLGTKFHQLFDVVEDTQRKKDKKKIKKKGKVKITRDKSKSKRDKSPEKIEPRAPTLDLNGIPSSFAVYSSVRHAVLEHQMKQTSQLCVQLAHTSHSDSETEDDVDDKNREPFFKMPKIVGIGLCGVFELIHETKTSHPALCTRALQALLDMLQGQVPEGLKNEPSEVIDGLYELLKDLATTPVSSTDSAATECQSLTALACACLLSLVIARGDTGKLLAAVAAMLMSPPALSTQEIKVPIILTSLQKSVQAVLLGRTHLPDWLSQGIREQACVDTIHIDQLPTGETQGHSALASSGQYLYIHNCQGLHKIGSGFGGTIRGHLYQSNTEFYPKQPGWLAFASKKLFYRPLHDGSGLLTVVDTDTLQPTNKCQLEGKGYGPHVMFSDGENLGHVSAAKDDSFVVRCFKPVSNPMVMVSELSLKLARKCLETFGMASFDTEVDVHSINTGFDEDTACIAAGKEFGLVRTVAGKMLYTGKSQALGIKQGGPPAGKWAELPITKSPKIVQFSIGHDGMHALLVSEDGSVFFVGTPKRGEDGDGGLSAKGRRQPKAMKPKKMIKVESKHILHSACNSGTSALVTREGEVYMFGKDTLHCDDSSGHVTELKDVAVTQVALGKAHAVVLSGKGHVYTYGINNKGQCGREYVVAAARDMSAVTMAEAEEEVEHVEEEDFMCAPGKHKWKHEQCMVCTHCGECTGYGGSCVSSSKQERTAGQPCGCGSGDSGCTECGICRTCGGELEEMERGAEAANGGAGILEVIARSKGVIPLDLIIGRHGARNLDQLSRKLEDRCQRAKAKNHRSKLKGLADAAANSDYEQDHVKMSSLPPGKLEFGSRECAAVQIACGLQHTVVLLESGEVFTFGSNQYGQLGVGDTLIRGVPTRVPLKATVVQVAAGANHTVLLTSSGQVYTFGSYQKDQLGRPAPDEDKVKDKRGLWYAIPGQLPAIGAKHGRRATWVGASGDQTYLRIDESLINAHTLGQSNIIANHSAIGLVPNMDGGPTAIKCLMISKKDGSCKSFVGPEQANLAHHSLCLDPVYDVLWSYSAKNHQICCYFVMSCELRDLKSVDPNYCDITSPELSVPVRSGALSSRSHTALHMLGCLDTLITSLQLGLSVYEEEKEKQTTSKVYTKEDYSVVNRFESHGGGWGYSGHSIEAVRFMADTDVMLGGFGLFGGRGEYFGKIKVFELGLEGGENETDGDLHSETEETPYECGAREKFALLFDEPVLLQANHWYVAWARISGPSSDCGSSGQASMTTEDQVVFKFKSSKKSNNGTDVNAGQIPQILYRLPSHDSSVSNHSSDLTEPAHVLSVDFARVVSPECFESLLKLLNWSWNTFCAAVAEVQNLRGTSLQAAILDLERLVYICTSGLRLISSYISEVYPNQGVTRKTPAETCRLAECVGETRTLLRKILAESRCQVVNSHRGEKSVFHGLMDRILEQCHQTFVKSFHAFYPTASLKWTCLCDLLNWIEPGQNNVDGCGRLLAAVMEALCHPTVKLTSILPINCEHGTKLLLRKQYSIDDNTNSEAQSGDVSQFPLLVGHMIHRTEMEGSGVGHWTFKEVLDKLLTILVLPVRQSLKKKMSPFPTVLVSNTCMLLSAIISELAALATGTEMELTGSSRPMLTTSNRFTRTSPSAYWNAGNGSPDAVCFSVDKPGIVIAGICVYGGGGVGQYDYEAELLDDQGEGSGDPAHSGRWNPLEVVKGTFGPDDCLNDIAEIKFDKPVPIKEGAKYALRLRNRGPRTLNGDGGMNKLKCPDGTAFTFSACSLSTNGTNHTRGQIPQILYYSAPQDGENHVQNSKAFAEYQARKNAIGISSAIFRVATDLMRRSHTCVGEHLVELVGQADVFSTLLPMVAAYIGPVAATDPRGAVQVLGLVQEILPPLAELNCMLAAQAKQAAAPTPPTAPLPASTAGDGVLASDTSTTSQHYAVVESDHPYKPANVANYRVRFPEMVKWMVLEFDPQCGTAQIEDTLQLFIPAKKVTSKVPWKRTTTEQDKGPTEEVVWWPVLRKFHGNTSWPRMSVVLPGSEVCFSLETASDYVKDDKARFYGFKCSVVGYEWGTKVHEGLGQLEKELSDLGGMCAASLMKKDIMLPPGSMDDLDEDIEGLEDGAQQIFSSHPQLLSKGFALSNPPTITQALEGNLPFSCNSIERTFLKDFVACAPGTSGGRLAAWLQPDSYLDPKQCDVLYNREELKCGWPSVITVQTKDQYGRLVDVPNLKVEVRAEPIVKDSSSSDRRSRQLSQHPDANSVLFGGHVPPKLEMPYTVTVKDKKDSYHAICMMKAYDNYSFEELRYAAPPIHRPSENMLVRTNSDGTYNANWTPASAGWYSLHVTLDGYETGDVLKVEVKDAPQGVPPPSQVSGKKSAHQPNKMRKFVALWSAGLRIRVTPSLQSEQVGVIKPNGVICFIDELHNDDGVWLRLSQDSMQKWCPASYTEGWALQYNQHLGKTMLVPVEEPKSILDEIIKETILRRLPELMREKGKPPTGGPGSYQVVKCGSSGHNIRCSPQLNSTAIGMMVLGNQLTAIQDATNAEGTWVKLDPESMQHYCNEVEGEAWSLARDSADIVYLQHEADFGTELEEDKKSPFGVSPTPAKGFDFTTAQQTPSFSGFAEGQGSSHGNCHTWSAGRKAFVFGQPSADDPPLRAATWPRHTKPEMAMANGVCSQESLSRTLSPLSTSRDTSPRSGSPRTGSPRPASPLVSAYRLYDKKLLENLTREIPAELQGVSVKDLVKALGKVKLEKQLAKAALKRPEPDPLLHKINWESELRGVSVKSLIRLLGESRVNGNGVTPPRTPPGTPKKTLSRSSSPKPIPGSSHQERTESSPRGSSPHLSVSPKRDLVTMGLASGSSPCRTPPHTPPCTPPISRRASSSAGGYTTPPCTPPSNKKEFATVSTTTKLMSPGPSPQRSASSSPQRSPMHTAAARAASASPVRSASSHQGSPPLSQEYIKGHFNIGASSPKEEVRLSPKTCRKDRSRQLRTKQGRAMSPMSRDKTPGSGSRSRSGSLQGDRLKDPVSEAMSPSVAQCVRAVFAAFMWHEGIVHDAMACASFLKFHPNLSKERPKVRISKDTGSGKGTPSNTLKKQNRQSTPEMSNINMNDAVKKLEQVRSKERHLSESKAAVEEKQPIEVVEPERESDLPPTLQHLVHFWENLSVATLRVVTQNLILPSPAVNARCRRTDKKDHKEHPEKEKSKSKKKKDVNYRLAGRGNLFGDAAGGAGALVAVAGVGPGAGAGAGLGGERETVCELCGGMFPNPVTYHMRRTHPGCGRHAGGQGFNSGGNFCGGWAGNCGDGGIGGSTWYLMCDVCREKYLREKRQAMKDKSKKSKKKSATVKQPPMTQAMEAHMVMKNNAMFLLDLASSAGFSLPAKPQKQATGGRHHDTALPSVSEDDLVEQCPFAPVPFLFLCQKGAEAADSAFAEDMIFSDGMAGLSKSGNFDRSVSHVDHPILHKIARSGSEGSGGKLDTEDGSHQNVSLSAQVSPCDGAEENSARQVLFQRSISEIAGGSASTADQDNDQCGEDANRLSTRRRINSGGMADGGMSLLKHPSAAMTRLIQSAEGSNGGKSIGDKVLHRPVMGFVIQRHDLEGLQVAMKQSLRKAACRVFALQAFNWLVRSVTQATCVHDLLWYFVASLTPPQEEEPEEEEGNQQNKKEKAKKEPDQDREVVVCEHPLSDISIAGNAVQPLLHTFHTFLQTISDVMMYLPPGSALQQMAVRCWCLKFKNSDHIFLHKSHVFSNISKILSKSDEGWGTNGASQDASQATCSVECLKDLTPLAELKASSRQGMIASLTDNSTETFWESGDEDRNKTKTITVVCQGHHHPRAVHVHVDNSRDLGNKVNSVVFSAGPSVEDLHKLRQVELESRHFGWVSCIIPDRNSPVLRLELKGPDNSLRLRQIKVLGEIDGSSLVVGRQESPLVVQQKNCEAETLRVFRLLTSQVFGRLISDEVPAVEGADEKKELSDNGHEGDIDLKEHMVGILFSRSKLTHLQKQVCAHIVQAIRKETIRVREVWESRLVNGKQQPVADDLEKRADAYCFELLNMVLALSGSVVGRTFLAQQHSLMQDLLTLLHTASPRVQRQVTALLRRVLPEVTPATLASHLGVQSLPPADFSILANQDKAQSQATFDPNHLGIMDVFLACIAKSLTVQSKVKGQGSGKGMTSSFKLPDCLPAAEALPNHWWLRGSMCSTMSSTIIQLMQDLAAGKLSDAWAPVTKGAVAEAILALTKLPDAMRDPAKCVHTTTLWLALASLCVLDQEHVDRLSSGQWVTGGEQSQPRPTCDNHDDGETSAIILCSECGNLCADCDRFLHLHRKTRSHQRQVFKEEEEAIRVDLHEGCGRTKLFWLMALADSKTLKALVEFRDGAKGRKVGGSTGEVGTCRFCGASANTGLLAIGNVCSDADCQENAKEACTKTLPCGHACGGINGEDPCLPCLHGCSRVGQDRLKQDADDMCMVCFTEALSAGPAIQLKCGHVFHVRCCRHVLEKRWVGPRITFGFSLCPICKSDIDNPVLQVLLDPIRHLYEDVRRKALMRLEYEGLHKAEAITTLGARFHKDPAGFAMDRYAYYVCFKCTKAYYGGEARCEEAAEGGDEYDPAELVCGACSDVSRAQMCPKHGTDFLEYKCRYCCSVAVFFCFGTTHFCQPCHDDFQRVTNVSKLELPRCPAGPKAKQLEGDECPLHVQHPPTGEEFALGCGVCRNAHTF